MTNGYDTLLRRTKLALLSGATELESTDYSYDSNSGRLDTVSDGTHSAEYDYLANSGLVEDITFKESTSTRMTTTKSYDYLNRLTNIVSSTNGTAVSSFRYVYNNANQRTSVTNVDGSYWVYEYDALGQVTSGRKHWSDGTPVAGQQFDYAFDDIGNRETAASGGNNSGTDLQSSSYTANLLNQYSSRTVPAVVGVSGTATNTATVTVNFEPTGRKGDYWWAEAPAENVWGPLWLGITNIAVLNNGASPDIIATNFGHVYVPQSPETFTYDDDGNLTGDSLWTNTWNGENRRTTIESRTGVPIAGKRREQWTYLPDGRWVERIVSTNNGSSYYPAYTNRYVWDGNVLLAVLDEANAVEVNFARGLDLSGTQQGAGGTGGLLWVTATGEGTHFVCFDGNGNVMALVDASDSSESARYEYGPFSENIRATGPMAQINPMRFSTQYTDDVTGDRKYKYRDYDPDTGRWPSRDPFGELGFEGNQYFAFTKEDLQYLASLDPEGENLDALEAAQNNILYAAGKAAYVMVNNDPVGNTDLYGLVCNVVANRTKALMSSGINAGHEWIVYDGKSVGFWPNRGYWVERPDPAEQAGVPIYWQWDTEQKKSGKIKWGSGAGKSCACATCADILASIDAAPNPGWHSFPIRNNCRRFVKWVFNGSCLKKGKKTSFTL